MSGGPGPRALVGRGLCVLGLALIVWGVLSVTSSAFGTRPTPSFAERRGYDQVKEAVHESFPYGLLRAVVGLALVVGGAHLARRD